VKKEESEEPSKQWEPERAERCDGFSVFERNVVLVSPELSRKALLIYFCSCVATSMAVPATIDVGQTLARALTTPAGSAARRVVLRPLKRCLPHLVTTPALIQALDNLFAELGPKGLPVHAEDNILWYAFVLACNDDTDVIADVLLAQVPARTTKFKFIPHAKVWLSKHFKTAIAE
jgi:hypothetical protein